MTKIVDTQNRQVLFEGRNNGMAFGFLEKKGKEYHTVQPPSPCKDYLAEVVFTEKHGIPTRAYGLDYKKKRGIFSDVAYMTIKMMKSKSSSYSKGMYNYSQSFENDVKLLKENYKHVERLINDFEKRLKLKTLTTITPKNDDFFLVEFSSEWCQSTHSISLYSLLLRVLMVATKSDKDIMSFLKSYTYNTGDKNLLKQTMHKIESIYNTRKLPPNTHMYSKGSLNRRSQTPHDNGIVDWTGSFNEVKLAD